MLLLQLQLLARAISGCIVTSSACLPEAVIEALLRGGCKALVCCKGDAEEAEEPPQAAAFFSMLYEQLNAGSQLLEARSPNPLGPYGSHASSQLYP